MSTLKDIKKDNGLTNQDIARSLGCSVSKVSTLLQGRHIHAISDEEIDRLATALSVTFERCWYAMCESYNEWAGTPGAEHKRFWEGSAEHLAKFGLPGVEVRPLGMVDGSAGVSDDRWIPELLEKKSSTTSSPKRG